MSKLIITISGDVGAGKTTLAQHLAFYLRAEGMQVTLVQVDTSARRTKVFEQEIRGAPLLKSREICIEEGDFLGEIRG